MTWKLPLVIGATVVVALSGGLATAVIADRDGGGAALSALPTSTVPAASPSTTSGGPATTAATTSTTRPRAAGPATTSVSVTTPPPTTVGTTARPATTTTAPRVTTTTRPALSRPEATRALCRELEAAVALVIQGQTLAGGGRLATAIGAYASAADPTVVDPARRMIAAGIQGDIEAGAIATEAAINACERLGYPIDLPIIVCVTAPCP